MSYASRIILCLFCLAGLTPTAAGTAHAGAFNMKQCEGSLFSDFQATYRNINGTSLVDAIHGCGPSGVGKIGVYQDRSGSSLPFGAGGQFRWSAPDGIQVVGAKFSARLNNVNGIAAQLIGFNDGVSTNLDGGAAHDGSEQSTSWLNPARPQTSVAARITCRWSSCPNSPTGGKAFMEVTDVELKVLDESPPFLAGSGELWDWAGDSSYHRGTGTVKIEAGDTGSGIAATWAEINGLRVDLPAAHCPGDRGTYATRFTPCPLVFSANKSLNTAAPPFQEGINGVRLCARDYADGVDGRSCTPAKGLLIDNQAPAPPLGLRSDQGTAWQPQNGFTLRWEIPGGQKAPIVGAISRLFDPETGEQVKADYHSGTTLTVAGPIDVPEVGAFRTTIQLVDEAGNLGEAAETVLRFDDRPPSDVNPEPAPGWVSKDELPLSQTIEKAEPGGPSGINGYALSTAPDGPTPPCETIICLAPEVTLSGGAELRTGSIAGLSEGNHWISAVAVSGARRSSLVPGNTMVQVDRTPPNSSISGVPTGWVNHPVTLTVQANDQLSGMEPRSGDDGKPKTVIDAESYATYASPGPFASFVVATEGVNRIRYWAEDLAGNANDGLPGPDGEAHPNPGQTVVRIDTTDPVVRFDPVRDPEDPELVRMSAEDADSGIATVSIGVRRAGSGDRYLPLPTVGSGSHYETRIPSDDLAKGAYEVSATVTDRAGNEFVGSETSSGDPMILALPLKEETRLLAHLKGGKLSLRSGYGSRPVLEGRLTANGSALPNQTVHVTETFAIGSSKKPVIRELTTDGDGRYRLLLGKGPSRTISASFEGTRKLSRTKSSELRLNVKGKVRFRFKPRKLFNGGVVKMRGSVGFRGALPPARGKLVAIQYFDPERRKWRPVEVLRTDRRGRFQYRYRFRTISSAQRIVFRASALPEAGWPYMPSTSKPRSVIVYPKG